LPDQVVRFRVRAADNGEEVKGQYYQVMRLFRVGVRNGA